jgi:hypothetical protein
MTVDLSQFSSLFEIGFALHIAVAVLERIYSHELPSRLKSIRSQISVLERFRDSIFKAGFSRQDGGQEYEIALTSGLIRNPVWIKRNDRLLSRLHVLNHESVQRLDSLRWVLTTLMILSIVVVMYSVTMLFLIGFRIEALITLTPLQASLLVLAQLLPLPLAAGLFYFIAHRMSMDVDRKLRGVGELNVILASEEDAGGVHYVSIEEIVRNDRLGIRPALP